MRNFAFISLILLLFGCSSVQKPVAPSSNIGSEYSEFANRFDVLTCVLWDGYCPDEGASRAYWKKRFGFGRTEEALAQDYSKLRSRYYKAEKFEKDPLKNKSGFFAVNGLAVDVVADAFLSSSNLSEALHKVEETVSESDRGKLKEIFTKFEPELHEIIAESRFLKGLAVSLESTLQTTAVKEISQYIRFFYKSENDPELTTLFTWWPPTGQDIGTPEGHFLVLRKNPEKRATGPDDDFALHEFTHVVSAQQPPQQKVDFTREFLRICPNAARLNKGEILEEPLAVALGQMLYLDTFYPVRFAQTKKWYARKWINHFAQVIFPTVKSYYARHLAIDLDFIRTTALLCAHEDIAGAGK